MDESEASSRDAWSFDFTELEASPPPEEMTCPGNFMDHTLVYRDSENDASLTCMRKTGDPSFVPAVRDYNFRCVLRQADGTPLLWFSVYDIGVKQLVATLGPPPNREERPGVLRGPERVLGMRLK